MVDNRICTMYNTTIPHLALRSERTGGGCGKAINAYLVTDHSQYSILLSESQEHIFVMFGGELMYKFDRFKLSALRAEAGYTTMELGKKVGVSDVAISKYERGVVEPRYAVACKIAEVFGLTADDFKV